MSNNSSSTVGIQNVKAASMRSRVQTDRIPRTPTAAEKRLLDQHVTAYPALLNADQLPARALQEDDFSEIDPLAYRRRHPIANNNAGTFDAAASLSGDNHNNNNNSSTNSAGDHFTPRPVELMTTKQLAAKMTQLGTALRAGDDPSLSAPGRRGYLSRSYAPTFDERSTYRGDYCQDEIPPLRDGAARAEARLSTHQGDWSETERADIAASMRKPFLTLPESMRRGRARPTYRCDYMHDADDATEVRALPHTVHLEDLGTTFAFSGYSVDDPRRSVRYDADVAALEEPHNSLEQSRRAQVQLQQQRLAASTRGGGSGGGARPSFDHSLMNFNTTATAAGGSGGLLQKYRNGSANATVGDGARSQRNAREELDAIRALRRESFERTLEAQQQRRSLAETATDIADRCASPLVVPGVKGAGYRRAPQSNQEEYIYLPQDHFRRCEVNDY